MLLDSSFASTTSFQFIATLRSLWRDGLRRAEAWPPLEPVLSLK